MSEQSDWTVRRASWEEDSGGLLEVRTAVFVIEQGVDIEIERDGRDPDCWHVLACSKRGEAIGAGRLMPSGKIGRVAVLKEWRRRGVGVALMRNLLGRADEAGLAETYLHSQTAAAGFYEQFGFVRVGREFEEAQIPHVKMVRMLSGRDR